MPEVQNRVEDRRNGVKIDLLPAGRILQRGGKVSSQPRNVTEHLQIVTLENLVSLKLDRWATNPTRQLKDKADVVELIKSCRAPALP